MTGRACRLQAHAHVRATRSRQSWSCRRGLAHRDSVGPEPRRGTARPPQTPRGKIPVEPMRRSRPLFLNIRTGSARLPPCTPAGKAGHIGKALFPYRGRTEMLRHVGFPKGLVIHDSRHAVFRGHDVDIAAVSPEKDRVRCAHVGRGAFRAVGQIKMGSRHGRSSFFHQERGTSPPVARLPERLHAGKGTDIGRHYFFPCSRAIEAVCRRSRTAASSLVSTSTEVSLPS